ncbi:MAG: DUF4166 domain-containing protein [Pirellulales bacterium]
MRSFAIVSRAQPLYRRLLGERFDSLPEALRRFHDAPGGGRAHGTLQVERAGGWFRGALASLLGLPEAGKNVPVVVEVKVEGDRERWVRHFAGRRVETVQWMRGELLMESSGATSFSSALSLEGSCLRYEFRRAWFAGIRLPRRLAPSVDGRVDAGDGGWRLAVGISAPLFGELVRYEGWVEPE